MTPQTLFRPASKQFERDGYQFKQVWRRENVAIYSQKREFAEEPAAWEVVKLRIGPAHHKDPDQSPKEIYPSSEEWGSRGWTYLTYPEALGKALVFLET